MKVFTFAMAFLLVLLTLPFLSLANAAEIHAENDKFIYFNGEIKIGDAEHFATILAGIKRPMFVFINSNGGDLAESMRIAQLVKGSHMGVGVTEGYCASSCFFILIEGFQRMFAMANDDNTLPSKARPANSVGYVGIHRPFFKVSSKDIASTIKQKIIMQKAREYLSTKSVPQALIDEMMSRPSNNIYWLNYHDVEMIGRFDSGDEEALIARCNYNRITAVAPDECIIDYWVEQYLPLAREFRAKLSTGWRPWA